LQFAGVLVSITALTTRRGGRMANTGELSREERKAAKRKARKELKDAFRKLTGKQVDELRQKPRGGVKGFLLGTNQEAE